MKKISLLIIISFASQVSFGQSATCKEVVGYYCDWLRDGFPPNKIEYSKYSVINFAFFEPKTNGDIAEGDPGSDPVLLNGTNGLISLAHKNNVKVMVSIGGWTWSNPFPAIAASDQTRKKFASECLRVMHKYKFDGIDIDWEYPGYDEHGGTSQDKANFTLLLQEIRNSIGSNALLSSCFGASEERMHNIEWDKVIPIIDMVNLMTYDYFGDWDKTANHNSPLYAPAQGDTAFNVHSSFQKLINKFGVPPSKVNIGVAFYGHALLGDGELFGAVTGADIITFPNDDDGSPIYTSILNKKSQYTEHWDDKALVPYLTKQSAPKSFVSYDNERSIKLKSEYVAVHGGRGVIIWEISGDYFGAGNTPLVTALIQGLCSPASVTDTKSTEVNIFPNPTNGDLIISMNKGDLVNRVIITNSYGQQVGEYQFNKNEFYLDMSGYEKGLYIVTITNRDGVVSKKEIKK